MKHPDLYYFETIKITSQVAAVVRYIIKHLILWNSLIYTILKP